MTIAHFFCYDQVCTACSRYKRLKVYYFKGSDALLNKFIYEYHQYSGRLDTHVSHVVSSGRKIIIKNPLKKHVLATQVAHRTGASLLQYSLNNNSNNNKKANQTWQKQREKEMCEWIQTRVDTNIHIYIYMKNRADKTTRTNKCVSTYIKFYWIMVLCNLHA